MTGKGMTCMTGKAGKQFVDTNILVYAHDLSAVHKHVHARELLMSLWNSGNGCLSIQVLQEFYVTVTRKVKNPISPEKASRIIGDLGQWQVHVPGVADLLQAIEIQQRHKLSFWDALIICSARQSGCELIWTEDLNNSQDYEGVRACSPFNLL